MPERRSQEDFALQHVALCAVIRASRGEDYVAEGFSLLCRHHGYREVISKKLTIGNLQQTNSK